MAATHAELKITHLFNKQSVEIHVHVVTLTDERAIKVPHPNFSVASAK